MRSATRSKRAQPCKLGSPRLNGPSAVISLARRALGSEATHPRDAMRACASRAYFGASDRVINLLAAPQIAPSHLPRCAALLTTDQEVDDAMTERTTTQRLDDGALAWTGEQHEHGVPPFQPVRRRETHPGTAQCRSSRAFQVAS